MTTLYAVFKEGCYRHECGGIFSTLELAEEAAKKLLAGERDAWHRYKVVPFVLDEITKQTPKGKPHPVRGGIFLEGGELKEPPAVATFGRRDD